MRWSCPHCGALLTLSQELLDKSWSFSKCYQCRRLSLIRRADVNVVKVDKAPPGEPILLPGPPSSLTSRLTSSFSHQLLSFSLVKVAFFTVIFILGGYFYFEEVQHEGPEAFHSNERSSKITDQVKSSAMAPIIRPTLEASAVVSWVQARFPKINIHSGPGLEFSIIGSAELNQKYEILGWNGQWLKIRFNHSSGWVRDDQAQVVSARASTTDTKNSP